MLEILLPWDKMMNTTITVPPNIKKTIKLAVINYT